MRVTRGQAARLAGLVGPLTGAWAKPAQPGR